MKGWLAAAVISGIALTGGLAVAASPTAQEPAGTRASSMRKFQEETRAWRDEVAVKRAELEDEYQKAQPDEARVTALEKDIVDLRARIRAVAQREGVAMGGNRAWGRMGGRGGGRGCGCW